MPWIDGFPFMYMWIDRWVHGYNSNMMVPAGLHTRTWMELLLYRQAKANYDLIPGALSSIP